MDASELYYKRYAKADVVGWTDAGIGTNGEVGLGWMVLERAWPHEVVAMGHVYQSADEAQDGKDSSREELRALTWAHWHMRQIRLGRKVEHVRPLPQYERKNCRQRYSSPSRDLRTGGVARTPNEDRGQLC